jgi:hypothetical protein
LPTDNYHLSLIPFYGSFDKLPFMKKTALAPLPSSGALLFWKTVQMIFWFVGIALLLFMLFMPPVGVTLFWNILIPVAPLLLVVGTGFWRNVCPLGTTALLPDRLGLSKKKKLSSSQRSILNLVGIVLLFLIIPLRHLLFNTNGQATAIIILALSVNALIAGFIFERKSGWCSGLCPIHPVEKLYGSGVAFSLPNAHCRDCVKCSVPCPDSTPNISPFTSAKSAGKAIEILLVGGFPGYVWGWFQVPDYTASFGWEQFLIAYGYPLLGAGISIFLYMSIKEVVSKRNKKLVIHLFAASAVSCYYWFRLPMLFGFSSTDTNGVLIDLTNSLPAWSMSILQLITTSFFLWWMVIRKKKKISWSIRPKYAQ